MFVSSLLGTNNPNLRGPLPFLFRAVWAAGMWANLAGWVGRGSGLQVRLRAVRWVSFWAYGCLGHVLFVIMAETPETKPKLCKHASRPHFHPLISPWPKQVPMTTPKISGTGNIFSLFAGKCWWVMWWREDTENGGQQPSLSLWFPEMKSFC